MLQSWLHSLTFLRNLCAHHSRIWNRKFKIAPIEMKKYKKHFLPNYSYYAQASMLYVLLNIVSKDSDWHHRLHNLFLKHPCVSSNEMGFPRNWEQDEFWKHSLRQVLKSNVRDFEVAE